MALTDLYIADLMLKLVSRKTDGISRVSYVPQKKDYAVSQDTPHLPRATPEAKGVKSVFVKRLMQQLGQNSACRMHKCMIVKDGAVIAEKAFGPYPLDYPHVTHSMCKSVTGMAIGLLISENRLSLDDNLYDLFHIKQGLMDLLRPRTITVRQLLTMTSGVQFNEAGILTGDDWRQGYLTAPVLTPPGTKFEYNSMNSYMLSAIVTELTGEAMDDYLKPRLFEPMGIRSYLWERCPKGITKGGWGMYLCIEDMCKLGLLYLQHGAWEGKQLVDASWVEQSTSLQFVTEKTAQGQGPKDDYGYHIWMSEDREGAFTYNGMLGQNVYCYPDVNMVVATNAANDDVFQQGRMSELIRRMMREELDDALQTPSLSYVQGTGVSDPLPEKSLSIRRGGYATRVRRLSAGTKSVVVATPVPGALRRAAVNDSRIGEMSFTAQDHVRLFRAMDHTFFDTDLEGVGVLPLMIQVFRNNYTKGIHAVGFRFVNGRDFYIDLYEGEESISLLCNFSKAERMSRIDVNGEKFTLCVQSRLTTDKNNHPVLRNRLMFTDESSVRLLDIHFDDLSSFAGASPDIRRFRLVLDEEPGADMIIDSMKTMRANTESGDAQSLSYTDLLFDGTKTILMKGLRELGAFSTLRRTIEETVRSVLHATRRADDRSRDV